MAHYLLLLPVGILVGAFGTVIGAGGGFVLVPVLLLLYPAENPETITSISLAVVFFNALSGSIAYARLRRVDYQSGFIFSIATVPGAILGAATTSYFSRWLFDAVFGIFMIVACVLLIMIPPKRSRSQMPSTHNFFRSITEANGTQHQYSYNLSLGIGISLVAGYFSSLLGVGGGFIHVPSLVYLLNFPVHIATSTSQFILAVMSLAGTAVHAVNGTLNHGIRRTVVLSIGVLVGAQLGARTSDRIHGDWIIRGLALALGFVGIRLLWTAL